MMAGLTDEQKARGVITASAGNHAQGVAFSSARLGLKALIVMPVATADIKVDAVRGFGGEVLLHGANFDEAKAKAIELAQQQGFTGAAVRPPDGDCRAGYAGAGAVAAGRPSRPRFRPGGRRRLSRWCGGADQTAHAADQSHCRGSGRLRLPESGAGCRASCGSAARRAVCRGRGGEAHWRRNVPPVPSISTISSPSTATLSARR